MSIFTSTTVDLKAVVIFTEVVLKTIIETLEEVIPHGYWCYSGGAWCKYHEIKKPTLDEKGSIQSNFCHLSEEFVSRKECGINE
jgi:hypothetical protein